MSHRDDTRAVREYLRGLQDGIVAAMEGEGGQPFGSDQWQRPAVVDAAPVPPASLAASSAATSAASLAASLPASLPTATSPRGDDGVALLPSPSGTGTEGEGGAPRAASARAASGLAGEGLSRLIEDATLLERGGCGFSHVRGSLLPPSATQHRPELAGAPFEAMGVSLVFHPRNPYVPTVHMNVRMLAATPAGGDTVTWFGGGMDLTPYYGFEDDAAHFHRVLRHALLPFGDDKYPRFKQWCDDYFFLKHRNEPRGIGGVFFDDFSELGFERSFAMLRAVGDAFLPAYLPILRRRNQLPFGERERDFQAYRRGRYVEFNLVFDRGTLFGLQSGGRTESILMSLPPLVKWRYDWHPQPGTPEARLYSDFLRPRDWAAWDGA